MSAPPDPLPPTDRSDSDSEGAPTLSSAALWSHSPSLEKPGDSIGPYRLLSVLGEGGFGIVYLAERREPHVQRVALKIIKPGMDSRAVIARFEQERQALAVMDHPSVAKVYDAGTTPNGRPYFVMEHVQGEPITEYCDRHRLTIRQRLELFIPVCEAVQHAHHKGLIHRDLKPSNVLVAVKDEHAIPKVIDFGVAKAISHTFTDKTIFTDQGVIIGTPEYMSPEQAEMGALDIDTRTDVYSLGAVLYELLAGEVPFDSKSLRSKGYAEIQRIIREIEPPKPSTRLGSMEAGTGAEIATKRQSEREALARELRRELDWIPLKALRKDRTQRYGSPADLARDIRNYLDGKPLEAGPESAAYRARKFVRRHRLAIAVSALVVVALALGMAVALAGLAEARREREKARQRAADLQSVVAFQQRLLTSIEPSRMGATIIRSIGELAAQQGGQAGSSVPPGFDAALRSVSATNIALDVLDAEILSPAAAAIARECAGRPVVEAALRQTLAWIYRQLGLFERALPHQDRALALREAELGESDPDTILSRVEWCELRVKRGEFPRELCETSARIARDRLGLEHRLTLRADIILGEVLFDLGRFEEGEALILRTLESRRRLFGEDDPDTIDALYDAARFRWARGDLSRAETLFREVIEKSTRVFGTDDPHTAIASDQFARLLRDLGRYAEAEDLIRHSVDSLEQKAGTDYPPAWMARRTLGNILANRGRLAEAEEVLASAYAGIERALGPDNYSTAISLSALATVLSDRGKYAESDQAMDTALTRLQRTFGHEHWYALSTQVEAVSLRRRQGRLREARDLCQRSIDGIANSAGPRHPASLRARREMGLILLDMGLLRDAAQTLQKTLDAYQDVLGADHPDTLKCMEDLGFAQLSLGRHAEVEAAFSSVLQGRLALFGEDHPDAIQARSRIAALRLVQGRLDEAERGFVDVLEARRRVLGDQHPQTASSADNVGDALAWQGKWSEAEPYFREALEIRRRVLGDDHPDTISSVLAMGAVFDGQNKLDEAEPYFRKALDDCRRVLGNEHPTTLTAIFSMGSFFQARGALTGSGRQYDDALPYMQEALEGRRRVLGPEHPSTLDSMNSIGFLLEGRGELEEAERYYRETLEARRRVLGDEHTETLESVSNRGSVLSRLGRHREALDLLKSAEPAVRRAWAGGNEMWVGNYLAKIGEAQTGLADFAAAEATLLEAHRILAAGFGESHFRTIRCIERLVNLYDAWLSKEPSAEREAAAAPWRQRLAEIRAHEAPP